MRFFRKSKKVKCNNKEKIRIKVSIFEEVKVSKGLANYIAMLAYYAADSATRDGYDNLAGEFRDTANSIYNKLESLGYYK